jgi:hypothetical protein
MFRILLVLSVICLALGCGAAPEAATEEPVAAAPEENTDATYVGWLADENAPTMAKRRPMTTRNVPKAASRVARRSCLLPKRAETSTS